MSKIMLILFAALTAGSIVLSTNHVGVMEPSITKASVRQGSAGRHIFIGGSGHRVK